MERPEIRAKIYNLFDETFAIIDPEGENMDQHTLGRVISVLSEFDDTVLSEIPAPLWRAEATLLWQKIQEERLLGTSPSETQRIFQDRVDELVAPTWVSRN